MATQKARKTRRNTTSRKLGRYQIVDEIGNGAMGTIYKAIDPMLDRTVALKTINVAGTERELAEYEARFFHEAKAVGGLNHPNIVTIHDVGSSGNMPYLAMELLEGSELATLTDRGQPLPVEKAIDVAAQVAQGLAYAHEHGVVHRDIKPANIMLVHDGIVKIADFGIARMRLSEGSGEAVKPVGSPRYMSPEQVLARRADHRSDIFSLGVVLYEMLTGNAPFSGGDLNAVLFQIVNLVPPAPSTINPATPTMLDFIVAKALAKTPDERYATAREFADDLKHCRNGLRPSPRLVGVATPQQRAMAKIDAYAATPLLTKSYPDARQSDNPRYGVGAATVGVAKDFDSLAAMVRLAAQTGVAQNFEDLAASRREAEAAEAGTVHGTVVREPSSRILKGFDRWKPADQLIFAASVATATIVGVLIVLV